MAPPREVAALASLAFYRFGSTLARTRCTLNKTQKIKYERARKKRANLFTCQRELTAREVTIRIVAQLDLWKSAASRIIYRCVSDRCVCVCVCECVRVLCALLRPLTGRNAPACVTRSRTLVAALSKRAFCLNTTHTEGRCNTRAAAF